MTPVPAHEAVARSRVVRGFFIVVGTGCLAIAVVGLVVPFLPTTPFLLAAAASFARASERLHGWLLANRTFGPTIRDWQTSRRLPRRTKWTAIPVMSLTIGTTAVFFVEELVIRAAVLAVGLVLGLFLYRIPTSD